MSWLGTYAFLPFKIEKEKAQKKQEAVLTVKQNPLWLKKIDLNTKRTNDPQRYLQGQKKKAAEYVCVNM